MPPKPVCVTPSNLSTDINVQLTVLNAAGELSPVHLCLPEHPLIILRVNPIPGARVGQLVTLSFSAQMILKTISSILENGAVCNGAPIIIPISTVPLPPASTSAPSPESIPKTVALPAPPFPLGMKSAALSGARKMRAIAPKPSNSVAGSVSASSIATPAMRSISINRPARKLFAGPVTPNPLDSSNSTSTITPPTASMINSIPLIGNANARSVSLLRKANANSRNRARRKNPSMTFPPPVNVAIPTTTTIVPQSTNYIVDPTSGALISTNGSTVSGGFIQSILQSGPSGTQFFAPPGSILVGSSNGLIPMPISGIIPAESKTPDAETGDLITNTGNPYQSGFLVPADGINDGFSHQVFFTNGNAPNGQFLLPSYQASVSGSEYVQSFSTQQTEYLQTDGGELYLTSDGSCYMPYTGIIGQSQPVTTVDIKDDGSGVDVVSETDDIIDIAMRVAREDVDCNVGIAGSSVTAETINTSPTTIELTAEADEVISELMQSSAIPLVASPNREFKGHQVVEHDSPAIEECVLTSDQQTSTGDAKIDALLAEAALVSSVNGVGDSQSAVSVPVTSLLGSRSGVPTNRVSISSTEACAVVETSAMDMNAFSQSLYDSFANFDATMIPEPVPNTSTEAATEAAFTYVTQRVGDLDAEFGTATADLDVTPTHVTESFLKSLVNQADDLESEMASGEEAHKIVESIQVVKELDDLPQDDSEEVASQTEISDLFQLPFSRSVDDDVTGGNSDNFFHFSRGYTTPEQFDAALQLLGSQSSSNCSPSHISDGVEDTDDVVHEAYCDDAPIVPDSLSLHEHGLMPIGKSPNPESKSVDGILFGGSLLPPELVLSTISDSVPAYKGGQNRVPSPGSASPTTDTKEITPTGPGNADLEEDDDDSGSELDFLPSRRRPERNDPHSTSPRHFQSPSLPPLTHPIREEATSNVEDISKLPHPITLSVSNASRISVTSCRKSPRLPRQSTPRVRFVRRKSKSRAVLTSLRHSNSKGRGGTSSPFVSPRQLRSSMGRQKEEDYMGVSEEEPSDDILPLKNTISKDLRELNQTLCSSQSQGDSVTFPMLGNDLASSSRLTLDSTLPTEPCIEESTILWTADSTQLPKEVPSEVNFHSPNCNSTSPAAEGGRPENALSSGFWDLNGFRPTSFGLNVAPAIPSLIPINNFTSHLELKDNPVLRPGMPFWGDPNSPPTENDEDEEEPKEERIAEEVEPDDDSESDSSLCLLATIRAASLVLNLPFNSPIALPGNETAFTQFASSVSLPSFAAFVSSMVSNDESKHDMLDCTVSADTVRADDGGDDNESGELTPDSWIPDPTKIVFSESLFPPKFSPLSISRPPSVPILQDNISSSFSAIAESASETQELSTSPILNSFHRENSQLKRRPSLHDRTEELLTVSSQEAVVVEESLPGTRYLALECEIVPGSKLVSPIAKVVGPVIIDPLPIPSQPSYPSIEIIDLPSYSSNKAASSGSDCTVKGQEQTSAVQPPIRLKLKLSDIKTPSKKANRKRNSEQKSSQQQSLSFESPSALKDRKIGTILRFSRVDGTFRTQTVATSHLSPHRTTSTSPSSQPVATKRASTLPIQPIWAAAKRGRRGTGRRGGRGNFPVNFAAAATATTPDVGCCGASNSSNNEAPVDSLQIYSTGSKVITPSLPKRFFSSSREDRRSSAIRTTRPWRSTFGSMVRKRSRFCGSTDRVGSLQSNISSQPPVPSLPPSRQFQTLHRVQSTTASPPSDPIRLVIRLSKEKHITSESGGALPNSQVGGSHGKGSAPAVDNGADIGDDDGGESEERPMEEEYRNKRVEHASTGGSAQQFFVAPEAETFIDKNQARVRIVPNKALGVVNDNVPDDDEDDSSFSSYSTNERFTRVHAVRRTQLSTQRSDVPTGQHCRSHHASQPSSYESQQPPSTLMYNHRPTTHPSASSSATTVFSPLRCDMAVSFNMGIQQNRPSVEAVSSARSSSTASGSLPAPSTISPPAPFTIATTTSEAESNGSGLPAHEYHQSLAIEQQQQHFYQRQLPRQLGEPVEGEQGQRSFVVSKMGNNSKPPTPTVSAYLQDTQFARHLRDFPTMPSQQHQQQQQQRHALAAAYAAAAAAYVGKFEQTTVQAMWASSLLNNLGGGPRGYSQSEKSPFPSSNPYNQLRHQQPQSHERLEPQQQQPVFPPYRAEGDGSRKHANEAHQQPPYSLSSHFTSRVAPDSESSNCYTWYSQQYQPSQHQRQNPVQSRAIDRSSVYYSAVSPSQQQHQTSTSHPNTGLVSPSQWYQSGGVQSSVEPQAPSSTPGYSQIDNSAVVAAVASGGYRLPTFPRLS